jgi:uncharacterized membrane protein YccC
VISRDAARIALQIALVSLASYACGSYFTGLFHGASARIGGLWSMVSGIVVLQATRRTTWSSAWLRVLGTLIGSIIGAVYLSLLPFSAIGMAVCIFGTVLLCHAARIPDHARLAALTVAVIIVLSSINQALSPILNAALRFAESCIGTALAVLAVLMWPGPAERQE